MVVRRDTEEDPEEKSIQNSSSDTEDYLIEDILEKLSVFPHNNQAMTIKNRKERPKHNRSEISSNAESPPRTEQSRAFGIKKTSSGSNRQSSSRARNRQSRGHSSSVTIRQNRFPFSTYAPAVDNRLSPTLNRHWSNSHDSMKNIRERLAEVKDPATGNNSEDEYGHLSENSNSPKAEHIGLEQILKEKKGWRVIRVHGDGACLFRSVSHQVFGDEEKHDTIRKQVVDYMSKNREHFSQYVTEDFDRYLHRKRQPTCFGNHLEIQAISELYNRPVEIYYNNVDPINVFHAEYSHDVPIRLGYYGRTHYNSIIDPCKPTFGHGLGMPDYQPGLPEKDLVVQAIRESETCELEEAMLKDKLAESETKQLEDCISEHVLCESLYEHMKTVDRQRVTSSSHHAFPRSRESPPSPLQSALSSAPTSSQVACSSSAPSKPSSSNTADASDSGASAAVSISSDPTASDFAVLQYIPSNMLDMSEDDVLAMVLEQSRSEYIGSLRAAYDFEELERPTTHLYFGQNVEPPNSSAKSKEHDSCDEAAAADGRGSSVGN